ncbi:hypothetical protein J3L16_10765 [Alteromonas sp. 5E99-2]|uniref:hypothetical protein n=1 Tax=Alteromonas sp. 5E99-2 TaxID=2817683 RepID=UPI001A98E6A1|nr:hypothetical protein [Alteromonas sp. 5E99-2]MBO1256165.1 hypothetical protein [Alteromonas sp. 5E99-2]
MKNFNLHIIIFGAFSLLMGCGSGVDVASSEESSKADLKHNYQKPGAPIEMTYKVLTQAAQAGDEVEIEVSFDSPVKSTISTKLNPLKNMSLVNDKTSWQSHVAKSGEFESLPNLKLKAQADGLYYVTLVASIEVDGNVQSKPFVIPIKVGKGNVNLESSGEIIVDESGNKLIVHKAEKGE